MHGWEGEEGEGGGEVSLWGEQEEETAEAQTKKGKQGETETRAKEEEAREKEEARSMCGSMKTDAAAAPAAGEESELVGVDIYRYLLSLYLSWISLSRARVLSLSLSRYIDR
jgi:hypothetical protein